MALPNPQQIPEDDIIRKIKEVSDHNAGLLIKDGTATDEGFELETQSGDTLEVDLSEKFVTRSEFEDFTGLNPASEANAGKIKIVGETEAQQGEDDTKAMTTLKTTQLLRKWGVPKMAFVGAQVGQTVMFALSEDELILVPTNLAGSLLAQITALSPADKSAIMLALLSAMEADAQAKFCEKASVCGLVTTPVEYSFTGGVHYEAVPAGSADLNPTLNKPTADWLILVTGSITKVLEADEFTYNSAVAKQIRVRRFNSELNVTSDLPSWIVFDSATRTLTATITQAQDEEAFGLIAELYDPVTGSAAQDPFEFKVQLPSAPSITKVAYAFQKNNPSAGQGSNLDVYVSANVSLELAISATSDVGNLPKSGYTKLSEGTFQTDYNRYNGGTYGVFPTQTVTLYIRQQGTTNDLLVIQLPKFPNANVPLTVAYPVS